MEAITRNDTTVNIIKSIDYLRKEKHIRPSTEKIFNTVKKSYDTNIEIDIFKDNFDYLINNGEIEIRGEGENESVFVIKRVELNQTKQCDNENTSQYIEDQGRRDSIESETFKIHDTHIKCKTSLNGNGDNDAIVMLYERLISNLKSEIDHLKDQLSKKDEYFKDEIYFLRTQLKMAKSNENCNYAPQANLVMNKNDKKTQLINNQTASNEVTTGKNKQEKKPSSIKHTNSKKDNVINKRVIILGDSMIRNVRE